MAPPLTTRRRNIPRRAHAALGALAAALTPACVFDEESSLHRESAVELEVVPVAPSCADLGHAGGYAITFDPAESGTTFGEGGVAVTLEVDGHSFDFSASPAARAVIAEGPTRAHVYRYTPEAASDARLSAPLPEGSVSAERSPPPERVTFCLARSGCARGDAGPGSCEESG